MKHSQYGGSLYLSSIVVAVEDIWLSYAHLNGEFLYHGQESVELALSKSVAMSVTDCQCRRRCSGKLTVRGRNAD